MAGTRFPGKCLRGVVTRAIDRETQADWIRLDSYLNSWNQRWSRGRCRSRRCCRRRNRSGRRCRRRTDIAEAYCHIVHYRRHGAVTCAQKRFVLQIARSVELRKSVTVVEERISSAIWSDKIKDAVDV